MICSHCPPPARLTCVRKAVREDWRRAARSFPGCCCWICFFGGFLLVFGEALRTLCLNTWIIWCGLSISYSLCVLLEQAIVNNLRAETGR